MTQVIELFGTASTEFNYPKYFCQFSLTGTLNKDDKYQDWDSILKSLLLSKIAFIIYNPADIANHGKWRVWD